MKINFLNVLNISFKIIEIKKEVPARALSPIQLNLRDFF